MRLIILSGANNTGKTTILKNLYSSLVSNGGKLIGKPFEVQNPPHNDQEIIIEYCNKRLVICTLGDYSNNLEDHCQKYSSYDMVICATRMAFRKTNYIASKFDVMSTIVLIAPNAKNSYQQNKMVEDYLLKLITIRLQFA